MKEISIEEMAINDVLKRWAAWLLTENGSATLHPLAVLVRDNMEQSTRTIMVEPLSDDAALRVDGYLAKLRAHNPIAFNITLDYYVYRMSYRLLGKRWRCSHKTISNKLLAVKNYLAECLLGNVVDIRFVQDVSDSELRDRLIRELELLLMAARADRLFAQKCVGC